MEGMFQRVMQGFCGNLSDDDKRKMSDCCEKMAVFCPCGAMKDMAEADKKAMMEKMKSFCGNAMRV